MSTTQSRILGHYEQAKTELEQIESRLSYINEKLKAGGDVSCMSSWLERHSDETLNLRQAQGAYLALRRVVGIITE